MRRTSDIRTSLIVLFLYALTLLTACGSDNDSQPAPLDLVATTPPIDLEEINATYYEAIPYGPFAPNLFDIYLPQSNASTPLLLFIHGGGFTGGTRNTENRANMVLNHLREGIAFASIDYRLLQNPEPIGVIKPLRDSARALQFIRYHAHQFNIDPDNVILRGGSAGAGTSLWIAFTDDLADPSNEDPVLRQSTRIKAAIANNTQGTYDIGKWETVVFAEFMVPLLEAAEALGLVQRLLNFFGITELEVFDSPEILEYRASVDMLGLMSADDPPFFVENLSPAGFPAAVNLLLHHPNHALSLVEHAEAIGLEHVAYIPALEIADPSGETEVEFALRHFDR